MKKVIVRYLNYEIYQFQIMQVSFHILYEIINIFTT